MKHMIKIGKERQLLFNLQALREVNEKYGSMDDMEAKLTTPGDEFSKIDDFVWMITMMVNQAIITDNMDIKLGLKTGDPGEPITEEYVRAKLKPRDLMKNKTAILGAITQGCAFDSEEDDDDDDPDLKEIQASKNA